MPYEKIGKNEPVCIADDVPFEIPESWEWVRWGTLSESIQYGYNAPAQENGRIKMVRISDIQDNSVMWETVPYCDIKEGEIDAYLLKPNDILFARTGGTVGKSYLVQEVPEEAIYAGYLIRTRYSNQLCPQYLKYFMESELYWSQLREGTIATAQPNCNGKTLGNMLVPIPPSHEQIRIVEKLNAVMAHVIEYGTIDSRSKHLNNIFPERLKKSILQEAVQGKLVPQDPNDEPAAVLLERIRAEKQKLIAEGKIKKNKHESIIFRRDNSHYEKLNGIERCIDDEIPFEIPDSWCWTRIGTIFTLQAGKNISAAEIEETFQSDLYPCYGGNGIRGFVNRANRIGDYPIIGRQGALCGNINRATGEFYATEHAVCVETFCNIDVTWACFFLEALNLNQYATATAQPGLAVANINTVLIPVPPSAEQKRIKNKIEVLLPVIKIL
nr:restriction endonuclease subunit S [Agathobacter rectalis]